MLKLRINDLLPLHTHTTHSPNRRA